MKRKEKQKEQICSDDSHTLSKYGNATFCIIFRLSFDFEIKSKSSKLAWIRNAKYGLLIYNAWKILFKWSLRTRWLVVSAEAWHTDYLPWIHVPVTNKIIYGLLREYKNPTTFELDQERTYGENKPFSFTVLNYCRCDLELRSR